jgi:hypothetical protein
MMQFNLLLVLICMIVIMIGAILIKEPIGNVCAYMASINRLSIYQSILV